MNGIYKIGGFGALLFAAGLVLTLVLFLVVLPGQGIADTSDPAKVLPLVAANSPALFLASLLNVIFAVASLLLSVSMYDRLRGDSSSAPTIATVSGLVATAMYLGSGGVRVFSIPELANIYSKNQAGASTAYLAVSSAADGMGNAAFLAFGVWVLLTSWIALQRKELPKPVSYLGILFALADFAATFFQAVVPVGVIIGIVYFTWLGFVLWREPARASAPAMSRA